MGQVDTVYASAIFELAKESNKLEEFNAELKELYEIFKSQDELRSVLGTPVISSTEKKNLLEKLFKEEVSQYIFNFMNLLVDKGRIHDFIGISEAYFDLYRKETNIVLTEIYTVEELSEDILNSIKDKLSEVSGKHIEIKQIVDDTLLGGVKIKIGSKIIDSSVLNKLKELGESMREVSL